MSRLTFLKRRSGRLLAVLTAAVFVAGSPLAAPTSLAQTSSSEPAPSGPAAPAGFASDLIRVFDQAIAAPPPPGVDTQLPPVSSTEFRRMVGSLSQDELNRIYGANPDGWHQVMLAVDAYARTVTPLADAAVASPGQGPTAAPKAVTGAPAPSVIFEPTPCPGLAVGGPGGGFYQIYALRIAKQAAQLASDLLGTKAYEQAGTALLTAVGGLATAPLAVAGIIAILSSEKALQLASAIVASVASAVDIAIDVVQYLLNRAIGSCQYNNATAVVPVIDGNSVAAHGNVNASYRLGRENFRTGEAINRLLDARTQTIINQLNTAQTSLDQDLRHTIEEVLAGGNTTSIVSYQLPASLGGYLDSTPVGVQAIVTSTLAMMQAAKQPIGPAATDNLVQANKALAAGQYKQAFTYYQTAYGLMTR